MLLEKSVEERVNPFLTTAIIKKRLSSLARALSFRVECIYLYEKILIFKGGSIMDKKDNPSIKSGVKTIAGGVGEVLRWGTQKLSDGFGKISEKLKTNSGSHNNAK